MNTTATWRRSSYCANGACLEVGAEWTSSSTCSAGSCVECCAPDENVVLVRDSKLGEDSPILALPSATWREFISGVRNGEFACA